MTAKYFAILTNQGAARLANAAALGTKLNLTQFAVGDANGILPTPDPAQTGLINQRRIAPLNLLDVDPKNPSQIIVEQVIPENEGGFWIRELGLYDDEGVLIAVANCPETYKPLLQEGSGRTQTFRMILIVSATSAITLKIDPAVVLATRQYVDNKVIEVKAYADDLMTKHLAAANPHPKYAPIASPTFTGKPKAPTPPLVANDTQIATAEFVQALIAALVSGELKNKQPLDKTLTDLSGKDTAGILQYLGLGEAAKRNVGTTENTVAAGDAPRIANAIQPKSPALITAFVNFSVSGGVVTINDSYNVSSVVRTATGRFNVIFTNAMKNSFYCPSVISRRPTAGTSEDGICYGLGSLNRVMSVNQFPVSINNAASTAEDPPFCCVTVSGGMS